MANKMSAQNSQRKNSFNLMNFISIDALEFALSNGERPSLLSHSVFEIFVLEYLPSIFGVDITLCTGRCQHQMGNKYIDIDRHLTEHKLHIKLRDKSVTTVSPPSIPKKFPQKMYDKRPSDIWDNIRWLAFREMKCLKSRDRHGYRYQ